MGSRHSRAEQDTLIRSTMCGCVMLGGYADFLHQQRSEDFPMREELG
jgi:hypothetical protein